MTLLRHLSISGDSIPWPHRFQVSEFVNKKAFVFVPPIFDDATITIQALARAAGDQLGFEETMDPADAVRILCVTCTQVEIFHFPPFTFILYYFSTYLHI